MRALTYDHELYEGNRVVSKAIIQQIHAELERLSLEHQREVLEFVRKRSSAAPRGTPGASLLKFSGLIPTEDLREIEQAIEQGCERINPDEWSSAA